MELVQDYLHFYVGQQANFIDEDGNDHVYTIDYEVLHKFAPSATHLFLRSLESMTDEEQEEQQKEMDFIDIGMGQTTITNSPHSILFLLSKGFDIFGLIDKGIAMDKSKVEA